MRRHLHNLKIAYQVGVTDAHDVDDRRHRRRGVFALLVMAAVMVAFVPTSIWVGTPATAIASALMAAALLLQATAMVRGYAALEYAGRAFRAAEERWPR